MKAKKRFKVPIAFKLISITLLLITVTVGLIAYKNANDFQRETLSREKRSNREQAQFQSIDTEGLMVSYLDKIKVIGYLILNESSRSDEEQGKTIDLVFKGDRDLVSVEVISKEDYEGKPLRVVNEKHLEKYNLDRGYLDILRKYQVDNKMFSIESVFADQVEIRNSSIVGKMPLISIGIPIVKDENETVTHIAIGEIRLNRLQKVFGKPGTSTSYLIDRYGTVLAHPDEDKVFSSKSLSDHPAVAEAIAENSIPKEISYYNEEKEETFISYFQKTNVGVSVISEVSEGAILELADLMKMETYYIAGRILSVALFLIFLFSITITAPIEKLVRVSLEIAKGNFGIRSKISTRDEIGELGSAIDSMIVGLEERDKVRNVLNKFHGSTVAEDLLRGDLSLGGSRKTVTVFFSDIRDFTKYSEAHSAEEVVEMLNEYFQIMVAIINRHKGVVDKFIGDAIMAVWGAPEAKDEDSSNAVRACLDMRRELETLNEKRIARGDSALKIGVGLHTGDVISGTIGSDERMEYTVIGDAVNQAARIEASTKAFGVDLLLSDSTMEQIKSKFIAVEAGKVEVKGKSKPLTLYKIKGYYGENGEEVIVSTPYSEYEAGKDAKVKMAS